MAEKDIVYSSSIKYSGIFSFSDFYDFCYDWVMSEIEPNGFTEVNYSEKINGNKKTVEIEWDFNKKLNDYFKYQIKVKMKANIERKVEIEENGRKVQTNMGNIKVSAKGIIIQDYEGRFEGSAVMKMWRSVYEKFVINSQVQEFEGKAVGAANEFLQQAKSFLDLEGKK